ncbi:outer membrane protein [Swaminathania salitolerans LMG 21291]|uniref:Hedgehog/Intein (Hint) domain-containing protein n=2 Tax=Swaminathania salitolerans TaxID=182838 RepID=A0A511BR44_9PROT|nr:outer membrane protein [Swaminathania salitolerans LMG 21291]GEL02806.1 hypothetical protein SSA02_19690 [Swaminathania salitolerans]
MAVTSQAVLTGGSWTASSVSGITYYVSGSVSAYGVTTLSSIGSLTVTSGATVSGVMISGGVPSVYIRSGGVMTSSYELNGYTYVSAGGILSGNTLNSDEVYLYAGASSVDDTYVNSGAGVDGYARLFVSSGASLQGATLKDGATGGLSAIVSSGASVSGLTLGSGGTAIVSSGASIAGINTGAGSVLSLGAAYGSGTAALPPNSQGSVVLTGGAWTASSISGITYYISGSVSASGKVVLSNIGSLTVSSGAVVSGAVISGTTTPSIYISSGGTMTSSLDVNGYLYVSAGGTLSANVLNSNVVYLYSGAHSIGDSYVNSGTYADGYSDAIVYPGATLTSPYIGSASNGGFTVTVSSGATVSDPTLVNGGGRLVVSGSLSTSGAAPCFLADTMIEMENGETAVQDIRIGDVVVAYVDGARVARPVIWAGWTQAVIRSDLPDDLAGYPVRILKDALGENRPYKDLLVTAEHCLFVEGAFVPVRMLVNGRSVFYDRSFSGYVYYHIETDDHSVIMADGVLTESFLDTGHRGSFRQEGDIVAFGGRRQNWQTHGAASLRTDRAFVEPIHASIVSRLPDDAPPRYVASAAGDAPRDEGSPSAAETASVATASVAIVTDTGQWIARRRVTNGQHVFSIPADAQTLRIVSQSARPSDAVAPFIDDRRDLGVLVNAIRLFEAEEMEELGEFRTAETLEGWNAREECGRRWTRGNALIHLPDRQPGRPAILSIEISAFAPRPERVGAVVPTRIAG